MNNSPNDSFSLTPVNGSSNVPLSAQYYLYLPIIIAVSSLVGTIFSILCLIRFCHQRGQRVYFNYIYYHMLLFCLGNSVLQVPAFYVGVYLSWFIVLPGFCTVYLIHAYAILAGLGYLLMWASLERHKFLFQLHVRISFTRQLFPLAFVLILVYTCSILIILVPKCSTYKVCEACFTQNFTRVVAFLLYSFVLPVLVMIISTAFLLRRLFQQRTRLNKRRRWIPLKRMACQSTIYVLWYCVAYWPYNIRHLMVAYDPNQFDSLTFKNVVDVVSICGIQVLPIMTYFFFKSKKTPTQELYALSRDPDFNRQLPKITKLQKPQAPIVERF